MKKYLFLLLAFITLFTSASSQFFLVPLISTNRQNYNCPSKDSLAMEYFRKGDNNFRYDKQLANVYFKGAIQKDRFFCDAYYALASSYRSTKDYDSAMKYIDLTLENNKVDLWAMKVKGVLLLDQKKYNQAEKYFNDLITLQPREATWLYYYIQSLIKLNKLDSAMALTGQMEYLMRQQDGWNSKSLSFYLQGQIAFQKRDYKKAFTIFDEVKRSFIQNSEFCYLYGVALLRKEDPARRKAKRFIKRARKLGYDGIELKIREELNL